MSITDGMQLSERERLRFVNALSLAAVFCTPSHSAPGRPRAKLVGSTAFALHLSPEWFRSPDDVDIVWLSDDHVSASVEIAALLNEVAGWRVSGAEREAVFRGDGNVSDYRMERWANGILLDRLTLQHCRTWPDNVTYDMIPSPLIFDDDVSLAVEPFTWCIVHKLDAIFKPRSPNWVSSRCRDLFDLHLGLDLLSRTDEKFETLKAHHRLLKHRWVLEYAPPNEWVVTWSKLSDQAGVKVPPIAQAWDRARSLARQVMDLDGR